MTQKDLKTVAVIGGGLIGASWAALFARAGGYLVRAWDPSEAARESFADRADKAAKQLVQLGYRAEGSVTVVETLAGAVHGVDWVQENAPESVELKTKLYREIEPAAPQGAVIASSTSSLRWSDLSQGLAHPKRFILAHPFNPPHLMPLVELYGQDDEVLARAEIFYRGLDRETVRLKREVAGHLANRLASALWREAVSLVEEGVADVADIDRALVNGPGLRWSIIGAHMAYHLGGGAGGIEHYLQHLGPSQERRWKTLGNPQLTPELCAKLVAGIAEEAAGRSIDDLEKERDAKLMATLRLRTKQ
ncbi:3-hydroxyacyl-CoA dehydrogenase NAD-binding domain-containing protein [Dongia soli]|uniref:3-hydroxyacyl-CoA dehydrogenase NAD-binding domain-containing protein n=1 Tax=Dongia soli TaxID=600628 RepID=A0ABU5ECM8_9PROT|nr:3-hydroxyacyl-CoA dehydrogenase NAD-binding domain-containing protein [Dongia soli]MDY0883310.1 3-hydroxyacyl-CoA dehydrogenase NAD-binding domain-containing protein [Dongia soli]